LATDDTRRFSDDTADASAERTLDANVAIRTLEARWAADLYRVGISRVATGTMQSR
jgi:hypothetical protein